MNNEIPDGSSQKELGNGDEIYSREQETAIYIAKRIETAGAEQQGQLHQSDIADIEKRAALDYAQEKDLWIDSLYSLGEPFPGGGNENTLAYNEKDRAIYKSNNLFNSQNKISNLLESVRIHNELFPETKYEVVGFTGIDNGTQRAPYIEVVLRQDYVPDATQATPREIAEYMQSIGFEQVNDHTFTNAKYTVSDLRPRNVLKDANGTIYHGSLFSSERYSNKCPFPRKKSSAVIRFFPAC